MSMLTVLIRLSDLGGAKLNVRLITEITDIIGRTMPLGTKPNPNITESLTTE